MKKHLLYLFLLLSATAYSQGFKDRFFSNFSFTAGADVNFGPLNEVTYTRESGEEFKGYSKDFAVGILSYQYGVRINAYEKGPDFSLGLWVPITASISTGNVSTLLEGKELNNGTLVTKSISQTNKGFGRVSFPVFLQFSFGGGSTYKSDKEKGFTAGLGVDMSLSPLYINRSDDGYYDNIKIKRFNMMPAVNIGLRRFQKDQFIEYNLKFGYSLGKKEFKTESEELKTNGMIIMLTIGQILNY